MQIKSIVKTPEGLREVMMELTEVQEMYLLQYAFADLISKGLIKSEDDLEPEQLELEIAH